MTDYMTTSDAKSLVIDRITQALDNYIGEPKGRDWEPSPEMWDHVYQYFKTWVAAVRQATSRAMFRDEKGKPISAMDMTTMFFDAMRTGETRCVDVTATLNQPIRCIRVTLQLEDQDGEEKEGEGETPEVGDALEGEGDVG